MNRPNRTKGNRKSACILMTALVPHKGHQAMVEFARFLVGSNGFLDVFISDRSHEPVTAMQRIHAFRDANQFLNDACVANFVQHSDDNAPQNPSTPEEWNYWKSTVLGNEEEGYYDYIVASEPYGKTMANLIGAEFIPFDMDRAFMPMKGTNIRQDLFNNMHNVLPGLAKNFVCKVTMFGQESTGKTTMTNELHKKFKTRSYMIHEFARPYLEVMDDVTITDEKMWSIAEGQYALQNVAYQHPDRPFVFQDTDLASTVGYHGVYGGEPHPKLFEWMEKTKSDLYVVMNDEIPFEKDILRYGGDIRETTKQYWIDLLEKHNLNYVVVRSVDHAEQVEEIEQYALKAFNDKVAAIASFVRD